MAKIKTIEDSGEPYKSPLTPQGRAPLGKEFDAAAVSRAAAAGWGNIKNQTEVIYRAELEKQAVNDGIETRAELSKTSGSLNELGLETAELTSAEMMPSFDERAKELSEKQLAGVTNPRIRKALAANIGLMVNGVREKLVAKSLQKAKVEKAASIDLSVDTAENNFVANLNSGMTTGEAFDHLSIDLKVITDGIIADSTITDEQAELLVRKTRDGLISTAIDKSLDNLSGLEGDELLAGVEQLEAFVDRFGGGVPGLRGIRKDISTLINKGNNQVAERRLTNIAGQIKETTNAPDVNVFAQGLPELEDRLNEVGHQGEANIEFKRQKFFAAISGFTNNQNYESEAAHREEVDNLAELVAKNIGLTDEEKGGWIDLIVGLRNAEQKDTLKTASEDVMRVIDENGSISSSALIDMLENTRKLGVLYGDMTKVELYNSVLEAPLKGYAQNADTIAESYYSAKTILSVYEDAGIGYSEIAGNARTAISRIENSVGGAEKDVENDLLISMAVGGFNIPVKVDRVDLNEIRGRVLAGNYNADDRRKIAISFMKQNMDIGLLVGTWEHDLETAGNTHLIIKDMEEIWGETGLPEILENATSKNKTLGLFAKLAMEGSYSEKEIARSFSLEQQEEFVKFYADTRDALMNQWTGSNSEFVAVSGEYEKIRTSITGRPTILGQEEAERIAMGVAIGLMSTGVKHDEMPRWDAEAGIEGAENRGEVYARGIKEYKGNQLFGRQRIDVGDHGTANTNTLNSMGELEKAGMLEMLESTIGKNWHEPVFMNRVLGMPVSGKASGGDNPSPIDLAFSEAAAVYGINNIHLDLDSIVWTEKPKVSPTQTDTKIVGIPIRENDNAGTRVGYVAFELFPDGRIKPLPVKVGEGDDWSMGPGESYLLSGRVMHRSFADGEISPYEAMFGDLELLDGAERRVPRNLKSAAPGQHISTTEAIKLFMYESLKVDQAEQQTSTPEEHMERIAELTTSNGWTLYMSEQEDLETVAEVVE